MDQPRLRHQIIFYVENLFKQNQDTDLVYHNLRHTKKVVKKVYEIAANYPLEDNQVFILATAAWFHDTGHLFGSIKSHEERSVAIMRDYLETKKVDAKMIDAIQKCILATQVPQNPKTIVEEILCDADTFHLGTKEFMKTDRLLKKEYELRNNMKIDKWQKMTLHFLTNHTYFTPYCQALLNKGKMKNIEVVRSY